MEDLLNQQVTNIQISGIRRFFNLVSGERDVVSLTIGQPDFPTPTHVKEAGKSAIDQNFTTYTHNAGMLPLREAIANYVDEKYALQYDPNDEIITTVGASQAIDITFRTILNAGDEVILPGPIYPAYEPLIRLAGAKPIFADTRDHGFKATAEVLESYITEKTKCIVLPYPSNPTGVSLSKEELEDIVNLVKNKSIFILADEIYAELIYEKSHVSIGTFPEVKEQTIIVQGLSKSHSMTGWRIGYVLAPRTIAQHLLKVHQYNVSCPSSISQHAALEALTEGKADADVMRQDYVKRRNFVYNSLVDMGLETMKPDGAFYVFPKFPIKQTTSFDLGLDLVKQARLALVPGDAFSPLGQGYMRISYAYNMETLELGMERLSDYLKQNKLK
ncbi:aminotransferase A [Salinibacillus xinjiangensis]|uniref:Aminotransferase n=1 Tax=Salinibacillus xinjiangensis TaxID=1229268 RepID=A0A6G1X3U0_9BACI|nr:aminotransferase A [Salinibacillus xinjiangensis]MRG85589.1 aminotransferase A [Salinibacillus xinjiangensis]